MCPCNKICAPPAPAAASAPLRADPNATRHAAAHGLLPKDEPRVEGYSLTGIDLLFQWEFKRL